MHWRFLVIILIGIYGCSTSPISIEQEKKPRLIKEFILLEKKTITRDTIIDLPVVIDSEALDCINNLVDVDTIEFTDDSIATFFVNKDDPLKSIKDINYSSNYYYVHNDSIDFPDYFMLGKGYLGNKNGFSFTIDCVISIDSAGEKTIRFSGLQISFKFEQEKSFNNTIDKETFYRIKYDFVPVKY